MNRVVFLGQKRAGELAFSRLVEAQGEAIQVVAVCSNPSADNVWWGTNQIAKLATSIPFLSNESEDEDQLLEAMAERNANTLISVQHPHILSEAVLEAVGYRAFNLHNAKLPDYRGSNAVNHAILNGDATYTSTVHWMVRKVDMGSIAYEETIPIREDETAESLYRRSTEAGLRCFEALLEAFQQAIEIPKDPLRGEGRFNSRTSIDGLREIHDADDPVEVDRKSRAFFFPPFEPAFVVRGSKKYYVLPPGYAGTIERAKA